MVILPKQINYENDWIADSECSKNLTGNKEKLQNKIEYKEDLMVVTANNSRLPIAYVGKTDIMPHFSPSQVQVQDIYHVLGMKKNIL